MALTARQKQYIWLMGSYADKIAVQGRGYRNPELMYAIDGDELYLFGYSTPLHWLTNRGLVRKLDNHPKGYVLTNAGETEYAKLLLSGFGGSAPLREVKIAKKDSMS